MKELIFELPTYTFRPSDDSVKTTISETHTPTKDTYSCNILPQIVKETNGNDEIHNVYYQKGNKYYKITNPYIFEDDSSITVHGQKSDKPVERKDNIKEVIFNYPATIVYWKDGTKTVVKCGPHDTWDMEKGLAMAIVKKYYGNLGNFNDVFKKYIAELDETLDETDW